MNRASNMSNQSRGKPMSPKGPPKLDFVQLDEDFTEKPDFMLDRKIKSERLKLFIKE